MTTPTGQLVSFVDVGFNSDLYMVAATVLPVLFLALMLEGGGVARTAVLGARLQVGEVRRVIGRARQVAQQASDGEPRTVVVVAVPRAYGVLALPALACIVLFGLGEMSAVLALDARRATGLEHGAVLTSLLALPVVLVVVTAVSIVRSGSREPAGDADTPGEDPPGRSDA